MDSFQLLFLLLLYGCLPKVLSVQMCDVMNEIELEKERCENRTSGNVTSGCQGMWDIVACWPSARVGEVVTITCPTYFSYFSDKQRGILRAGGVMNVQSTPRGFFSAAAAYV
ncbi:vasoactive intestinal polypeptide receptor [Poecilia reticulata]|uniref:vasoactive intestinal polypeptide receptor n=1 Tax=Poecilia reticulata TaxID=8081 RepID=UPI0007EAEA28|nr:PREDICTED: vasoactive intestinal polypeptide receptor [Poecilia reticulata]